MGNGKNNQAENAIFFWYFPLVSGKIKVIM